MGKHGSRNRRPLFQRSATGNVRPTRYVVVLAVSVGVGAVGVGLRRSRQAAQVVAQVVEQIEHVACAHVLEERVLSMH